MRNPILLAALLLLHFQSFSQSYIDSSRLLYNNFFKYHPPGAVIADISFNCLELNNYQGKSTDSLNKPLSFYDNLLILRNGSQDQTKLPTFDVLQDTISRYRDQGLIPIAFLDYTYTSLDTNIYSWEYISFDSDSGILKLSADPKSFFNERTCRSFGVFGRLENTSVAKFILPASLLFTNKSATEQLFFDFGDGNGPVQVQTGKVITITYPDLEAAPGVPIPFDFSVRLGNINNDYLRSKLVAIWYPQPDLTLLISELDTDNACTIPGTSDFGEARIYIRFGKNQIYDDVLRRPFIMVEGFDIDENPNDNSFGQIGWSTVAGGISFDLNGNPVRENLKDLKYLSNQLYEADYDLIFVDFKDGGGDLFRNGNTLIRLIQWVNQEKKSNEELVVMGASMGGLLCRYALRKMELAECNHCTKLYGTFDSPHQGANIPPGIQYAVSFFSDHSTQAMLAYRGLEKPAAQQMLIYNISAGASSARSKWQGWLDTYGHPVLPRRLAFTNGDPSGNGDFAEGENLLKFCFSSYTSVFSCEVNAAKPGEVIFKGSLPASAGFLSYFFGLLTRIYFVKQVKAPTGLQYYDHAAGGTGGWALHLYKALHQEANALPVANWCLPPSLTNSGLSCFVPTFSALDMSSKDRFPPLSSMFPGPQFRREESDLHPFNSIFFHNNQNISARGNQLHVYFDNLINQNIDWLMQELQIVDVILQDELPGNSGAQTFNINNESRIRKVIPDLTITSGGLLQLNGDYRINYGTLYDPYPTGNAVHQEFFTGLCGSYIEIKAGGTMELGDNNTNYPNNNTAVLYVTKGSVIDLGTYGILKVNNGSSLVIEEGAILKYRNLAQLKLLGSNARIILRGKIELDAQSSFDFFGNTGGEYGYIHAMVNDVNKGQLFDAHTGARIYLEGNANYGPRKLLVEGGALVLPDALAEFKLNKTTVEFKEHSGILCKSVVKVNTTLFQGLSSTGSFGLMIDGNFLIEVVQCKFRNLEKGLLLDRHAGASLPLISWNRFENCKLGMELFEGNFKIESCTFLNSVDAGITRSGNGNLELIASSFKGGELGVFHPGTNSGIDFCYVEASVFANLKTGISTGPNTSVTLSCTQLNNNQIGVATDRSVLNLSPLHYQNQRQGGDNTFYCNGTAIGGTMDLFLEQGLNNFFKLPSNQSPFLEVWIPAACQCLNPLSNLEGSGNYWSPVPQGNNLLYQGLFYYNVHVLAFPNPVISQMSGNVLPSYNPSCFTVPSEYDPGGQDMSGPVASVSTHAYDNSLHVYPVPFVSEINVLLPLSSSGTCRIRIFDINGTECYVNKLVPVEGSRELKLSDLAFLKPGVYTVEILDETGVYYQNLLKL